MTNDSNRISPQAIRELFLYDPTTGGVIRRATNLRCDPISSASGYRRISINNTKLFAHRAAFAFIMGRWPINQIDHINLDRADNRWDNLREATNAENNRNGKLRINSTSGLRGVCWDKNRGKWHSSIMVDYKKINLGRFDTKEAAYEAYKEAASRLHGDFYNLG